MNTAVLVLENGQVFTGRSYGAVGETLGEAVFCTAMTGYQETLTDPSYHRQIVVATAPQIGNTGWNTEDGESTGSAGSTGVDGDSGKIWVAGYAVRNPTRRVSNWRATTSSRRNWTARASSGSAASTPAPWYASSATTGR